jgi:hypothetical protein
LVQLELSVDAVKCLTDRQLRFFEIDIGPSEAECFAAAQSHRERDRP